MLIVQEDRGPDIIAGLEGCGEAGPMPIRLGGMRAAIKPIVWLDSNQRQRLTHNIAIRPGK